MWLAFLKFLVALFALLLQAAIVLQSYSHGQQDERTRWRKWLDERHVPRQYFFHQNIYRPEPWE